MGRTAFYCRVGTVEKGQRYNGSIGKARKPGDATCSGDSDMWRSRVPRICTCDTMDTSIPDYIAARIRQGAPAGSPVVPNSTPVVAFGVARKARIATLGLNPSRIEFLDGDGIELRGEERRLETLTSLRVSNLAAAPDAAVERVFHSCNVYFHRRPYRWFDRLEKVLGHVNASYYGGSACHLDLVQWATNPTWGGLSRAERAALLQSDLPFLRRQLSQEHVRLLLLNGRTIVRACQDLLGVRMAEAPTAAKGRVRVFTGRAASGLILVGWNINL